MKIIDLVESWNLKPKKDFSGYYPLHNKQSRPTQPDPEPPTPEEWEEIEHNNQLNGGSVPPDIDCFTLPNGNCIASPCRLHDV